MFKKLVAIATLGLAAFGLMSVAPGKPGLGGYISILYPTPAHVCARTGTFYGSYTDGTYDAVSYVMVDFYDGEDIVESIEATACESQWSLTYDVTDWEYWPGQNALASIVVTSYSVTNQPIASAYCVFYWQ